MSVFAAANEVSYNFWPHKAGGDSSSTLNGSGQKAAFVTRAPKAGNILKVHFALGTVTTGRDLRVSLQGVTSATGFPDGVVGQSGAVTVLDTDDNTNKTATMNVARAVTAGEVIAVVIEFDSLVGNLAVASGNGNMFPSESVVTFDGASTWTKQNRSPYLALEYDDGSFEPHSGLQPPGQGLNPSQPNLVEEGNIFVSPVTGRILGVTAWFDGEFPTGVNITFRLRDSLDTILGTTTVIKTELNEVHTNDRYAILFHPPVSVGRGSTYRITLQGLSAGNIPIRRIGVSAAALLDTLDRIGRNMYRTKGPAGSWTNTTTQRLGMLPILEIDLTADTTPPSPAPSARLSETGEDSFDVEVLSVSGEASTTVHLQYREYGSNSTWTTAESIPAAAGILSATSLTTGTRYEWRVIEEDLSGNQADGTHGEATPREEDSGDLLEHYIGLSLEQTLQGAALTTVLQRQGYRGPVAEDVQEWLSFDMENVRRRRSRRRIFIGSVVFTVTCTSRVASERVDGNANAPWLLASRVRKLLETDISIREVGAGETVIATLNVSVGEPTYGQDEESQGTHYVMLTFTGTLVKRD